MGDNSYVVYDPAMDLFLTRRLGNWLNDYHIVYEWGDVETRWLAVFPEKSRVISAVLTFYDDRFDRQNFSQWVVIPVKNGWTRFDDIDHTKAIPMDDVLIGVSEER